MMLSYTSRYKEETLFHVRLQSKTMEIHHFFVLNFTCNAQHYTRSCKTSIAVGRFPPLRNHTSTMGCECRYGHKQMRSKCGTARMPSRHQSKLSLGISSNETHLDMIIKAIETKGYAYPDLYQLMAFFRSFPFVEGGFHLVCIRLEPLSPMGPELGLLQVYSILVVRNLNSTYVTF